MRRFLVLLLALFITFVSVGPKVQVRADSEQAYKDYTYQFDLYRKAYAEFTVAKNEYEKYQTLTSQATALEKTRSMMKQRDELLRTYLLLLNEKLNEDTGLDSTQRGLYQTLLRNEVTFLENHTKLIDATGSLTDADTVSKQLEQRNLTSQGAIRQILIALGLGQLQVLQKQYDAAVTDVRTFISSHGNEFSTAQQATIDRWLLQVTNKENLFQQKIDTIQQQNAQLKGKNTEEINRKFQSIQTILRDARLDLIDGTNFLNELVRIIGLAS